MPNFIIFYLLTGALPGAPVTVPTDYIKKYNRYIDSIFGRINKVLKKNYDPVNVRLQTAPEHKKKPVVAKTPTALKKRPTAKPLTRINE